MIKFGREKNNHRRIIVIVMIFVGLIIAGISPLMYFTMPTTGKNLVSMPVGLTYTATIWTTDSYGNPKTNFIFGETVYIHGTGFLPSHSLNTQIIKLN